MNLQTERIENHRAQFTVEIENEQLEESKRQAARRISRQVRIKGFRKGKAPYRLVAQYVGEAAILEEALDELGDKLYKSALDEADIEPYGPGALEDFSLEPAPTLTFTVPLQPEVDLKNFLDVRVDFEAPTISDEDVADALKQMRLRALEVVDADVKVAEAGHRVHLRVESEFIDGEEPEAEGDVDRSEADAAAAAEDSDVSDQSSDATAPAIPRKGDPFVNDENAVIILDPNEDPFTHGFVENIIGAELGSDVEFELTIPDDDADESIRNREVWFVVEVRNIEAVEIPELDDEFARTVSRHRGDESMDVAALRLSTREELMRSALDSAKTQYSGEVLQRIVDGADIAYADLMLDEQIDELIKEFERNLSQQGIKLDDYLRLTGSAHDELREQYREPARESLQQTLVLRELVNQQKIAISEEDVETRLNQAVAGYGGSPEIRKLLDTPSMRGNFRNDLLMSHVNEHLYAIGRGIDSDEAIDQLRERTAADAAHVQERSRRRQAYEAEDALAALDDGADAATAAAEADAGEDLSENDETPRESALRDSAAAGME